MDVLISKNALLKEFEWLLSVVNESSKDEVRDTIQRINNAPAVDAVSKEQYEELREAFVDFVCSGVHNPAPYCKNSCDECVDSYGYCTYRRCTGFNPDGRKYDY